MRMFKFESREWSTIGNPGQDPIYINLDHISTIRDGETGGTVTVGGESYFITKVAFERLLAAINSK